MWQQSTRNAAKLRPNEGQGVSAEDKGHHGKSIKDTHAGCGNNWPQISYLRRRRRMGLTTTRIHQSTLEGQNRPCTMVSTWFARSDSLPRSSRPFARRGTIKKKKKKKKRRGTTKAEGGSNEKRTRKQKKRCFYILFLPGHALPFPNVLARLAYILTFSCSPNLKLVPDDSLSSPAPSVLQSFFLCYHFVLKVDTRIFEIVCRDQEGEDEKEEEQGALNSVLEETKSKRKYKDR